MPFSMDVWQAWHTAAGLNQLASTRRQKERETERERGDGRKEDGEMQVVKQL